jgi:polyisoprenoid-binding protein YceI
MTLRSASVRFLALSACIAALGAGLAGPTFAEKAESGKSLVVPEAHKSLGTLYYALPGRDVQVSFSSKAPVENIDGNSNGVIGYAVAGKDADPAALQAGEWHLPVKSMHTGIKMRDGHLAGEAWLDADKNPDIVFQLKEVTDITPGKAEGDTRAFTATLKGDMTIHGVTNPISIPDSTITFRKAGAATEAVAKGDLLSIRAKYDITLSEYGVSNKVVGQKVAETIKVDTNLVLATVPPEEQAAPPGESDKPSK